MNEPRIVGYIIEQNNDCPVTKHSCFRLEVMEVDGMINIITDQELVNIYIVIGGI